MLDYVEAGDCTIGERLKYYRKRVRLSQRELADIIGVTPSTICNYENNKTVPSIKRLNDMAIALGTTMNMLLRGFEPAREKSPFVTG